MSLKTRLNNVEKRLNTGEGCRLCERGSPVIEADGTISPADVWDENLQCRACRRRAGIAIQNLGPPCNGPEEMDLANIELVIVPEGRSL